jgi:hypothetical protein
MEQVDSFNLTALSQIHVSYSLLRNVTQDNLEDLCTDGKIILKWILEKQGGKVWTASFWPKTGSSGMLL